MKEPWHHSNHFEALSQMLVTNKWLDKLAASRVDFTKHHMLDDTCLESVLTALSTSLHIWSITMLIKLKFPGPAPEDELHVLHNEHDDDDNNNDDDDDMMKRQWQVQKYWHMLTSPKLSASDYPGALYLYSIFKIDP